jgi:DNA modification methylase
VPEYVLVFRKPPSDLSKGYADKPVAKDKPLATRNDGTVGPWDKKDNWKHPVPDTGYSRSAWQLDAHAFWRSSGNRLLTVEELAHMAHADLYKWWEGYSLGKVYDYAEHRLICEQLDQLQRLPATFQLFPPHSVDPAVWSDITRMLGMNTLQAAKGQEPHLCPLPFDCVDRLIKERSMPGELVFDPFSGLGTVPLRAMKFGRIGKGCDLSEKDWRDGVKYLQAAEREAAIPTFFDILDAVAAE